jgi:large subunit ribosomal protein L35
VLATTQRRVSGVQGLLIDVYLTGVGGYKRKQSHLRHILTKKSSKRKRQLGEKLDVHANDVLQVRRMLPYS